jgi:hypothetical protein
VTIVASTIINRVSAQLVDINNVRWSRKSLLDWLSVGQRFIVAMVPQAGSTIASIPLVPGSMQAITTGSVVGIYDIIRNMGADGNTPGRAIGPLDRPLMDRCRPNWLSEAASPVVQCAVQDKATPNTFWVYPPSNGANYVQVHYTDLPDPLVSESTAISIPEKYEDSLHHYVMFRALSKHAEFAKDPEADKYLGLFNATAGIIATGQQAEEGVKT